MGRFTDFGIAEICCIVEESGHRQQEHVLGSLGKSDAGSNLCDIGVGRISPGRSGFLVLEVDPGYGKTAGMDSHLHSSCSHDHSTIHVIFLAFS
jgi:hypothetical protein